MIGIFDSGLGGMTVARAIESLCPGFPLLYFGDLARTPYGSKSTERLIEYSQKNIEFLAEHGATLIVIACNSAASAAGEIMRQRFSYPIIDVIAPAVENAVTRSHTGRVGIIGTRATIASEIYQRCIKERNPAAATYTQACPLLVPLVEEGWINRRETKMIVKKYIQPLRRQQVDTLILGCTHYPLLKSIIAPRIGNRVHIVDSSIEAAKALHTYLEANTDIREKLYNPKKASRYFVSDLPAPVSPMANAIFGRTIQLEKVHV
ncbi:glutamate racemase [Desulfogranum japonicum]|uniref:glutamate racemase n=1 Tax=Desulfogranum japonicum TaxID=231447 RepID=UPI000418CB44|nr:glutamate racemase [Desulfogranum japonicum]